MKTDNEYLRKIANDINVIKWVLIWPIVLIAIILGGIILGSIIL